jgi:glutathione S-transferase
MAFLLGVRLLRLYPFTREDVQTDSRIARLRRAILAETAPRGDRSLGRYARVVLLYDSRVSGNCYKVRLLLAHLGIEYERREVDVVNRTDRGFLDDLNPAKRVPTLILDDGRPLAESNAILWYFGEGTRLVPTDRYERAQVLQWMFFEQYDHEPALAVARFLRTYSGRPELYEARREELTTRGERALAALERHLDSQEWLVGPAMTIADVALFPYTDGAPEGGFELARYPAVEAWLARVRAEPRHVPIGA